MRDPERRDEAPRPVQRSNWTLVALITGVVVLLLGGVYLATRGNADQDKLIGRRVAEGTPNLGARDKLCASSSTYNLIKRDLFRRAAQVRGSDAAAFDRIAGAAVVRMENPVVESQDSTTGAVNCSGSLALDLPPGIQVVGGRRTLASDVDYTVTAAADGSGPVVLLKNAEAIVTPLATLGQINIPVAEPSQQPTDANATAQTQSERPQPAPEAAPQPQVVRPRPAVQPAVTSARPSFDCSKAHSRGELAICSDAGLASLDRQMASEYARAFASASADERDILRETAHRFYAYRDRCENVSCIADAYTGRMREIRDVMEGRWQPSQ